MSTSVELQSPRLVPLSSADLIDAAIRLYRRNFGAFLSIIAIVYVPLGVLQIALGYFMGVFIRAIPESSTEIPTEPLLVLGAAYGLFFAAQLLAIPIAQGALAIAVSRRYLGYPVTIGEAYGAIGARWGRLILAVLLVGFLIGVGVLLCFLPGVYLAILWMFVTPVIAIEGASIRGALARSAQLVQGQWWRCFTTYLLLSLFVALLSAVVVWPANGLTMLLLGTEHLAWAQALSAGINAVVSLIVQPVLVIGLVLLYYDMRVRKEGFDLYVLAKALGLPLAQHEAYGQAGQPQCTAEAVSSASGIFHTLYAYSAQAQTAGLAYEEARQELLQAGWPKEIIEHELPAAWESVRTQRFRACAPAHKADVPPPYDVTRAEPQEASEGLGSIMSEASSDAIHVSQTEEE